MSGVRGKATLPLPALGVRGALCCKNWASRNSSPYLRSALGLEGHDLLQNFRLDLRAFVHADVRNGRIVRQIDIDDFAVKTSICFKGLAPAGALVVVDRLDDVGRDRICINGESVTRRSTGTLYPSSDRAMSMTLFAPCECPTRTRAPMRPADLSRKNLGYLIRPVQVAGDLGLDSKCPKLICNPIKAGREHPEPTAQQNHAGFRCNGTRTPQQHGRGERPGQRDAKPCAWPQSLCRARTLCLASVYRRCSNDCPQRSNCA